MCLCELKAGVVVVYAGALLCCAAPDVHGIVTACVADGTDKDLNHVNPYVKFTAPFLVLYYTLT